MLLWEDSTNQTVCGLRKVQAGQLSTKEQLETNCADDNVLVMKVRIGVSKRTFIVNLVLHAKSSVQDRAYVNKMHHQCW